jgi:hypothetical protein
MGMNLYAQHLAGIEEPNVQLVQLFALNPNTQSALQPIRRLLGDVWRNDDELIVDYASTPEDKEFVAVVAGVL